MRALQLITHRSNICDPKTCDTAVLHTAHVQPAVLSCSETSVVEPTRNVTAHAQKPELVFLRNGRVHFNRRGGVSSVNYWQSRNVECGCKTTGYPLHSHLSPSLPLPCVSVCHQIPRELYCGNELFTQPVVVPWVDKISRVF